MDLPYQDESQMLGENEEPYHNLSGEFIDPGNKKVVVLYHANCPDGFTAAWVHRKFVDEAVQVEYIATQYGAPLYQPSGTEEILCLDYCPKTAEDIQKLCNESSGVFVIDHHKTALPVLEKADTLGLNFGHYFDLDRCGASLTWDTYNTKSAIPMLVQYVEDRDLWRKNLPAIEEASAFIQAHEFTFENWDKLYELFEHEFTDSVVPNGATILKYKNLQIKNAVKNGKEREVRLGGFTGRAVNCTVHFSEVAGALAEGYDFGVAFFQRPDLVWQYSLRSREGGTDVSELAKRFGGGGHTGAAGFESKDLVF